MPELPEVETVVRGLREPLIGRTVHGMWYDWPKTVRMPAPDDFAARIHNQTFRAVERRAKYILCKLDHDILVVHLKMTGRLYVVPDDEINEADRWLHFKLQLDGGVQLRFSDARKFGFVSLITDMQELAPDLGPEPLESDFTAAVFAERMAGRRTAIKPLLLDQTVLAGVGNIYADEALYSAKIHPLRPANTLTRTEIKRLHGTIQQVLSAGIEREGASVNWYRKPDGTTGQAQNHFSVYDQQGNPCPRCGTMIEKIWVAQRGTHFCPRCQKSPR